MKVIDLRRIRNSIYNYKEVGLDVKGDIDQQIYHFYGKDGEVFLNALNGIFAVVFDDEKTGTAFAVRDWIGEVPLHYCVVKDTVYFANFIEDLRDKVPEYFYKDVVALNRSEVLLINKKTGNIEKKLYYNFNKDKNISNYADVTSVASKVHTLLFESTKRRFEYFDSKKQAVLLSGGTDSMSVAYFISLLDKKIPAYTLQIGDSESTDVIRARMIAERFGLEHRIIRVPKSNVIEAIDASIENSEIYHLYNVFCAAGMSLMTDTLKKDGVIYVHTGEGGNECFGDYYDWVIFDEKKKQRKTLQTTSDDFKTPQGREAYVWGNLVAEKSGRYNTQLGSGLGKHGISRMYKPMYKEGITLISPYFEKQIMKILTNIPEDVLEKVGGKAGFMSMVFSKELEEGKMSKDLFEVKKIRLQDASEDGVGDGLTETLLSSGYDQKKVIDVFNATFKADIIERKHLTETILVKEQEE